MLSRKNDHKTSEKSHEIPQEISQREISSPKHSRPIESVEFMEVLTHNSAIDSVNLLLLELAVGFRLRSLKTSQ